tara:strand:- start:2068 stop:3255 length:1188 start_codon:yes stop_codon:yes gene_type:complete
MSHASIIPLIGGETIAMQNVFGEKPQYILSYTDFEANDSQLLDYYNRTVPYIKLDMGGSAPRSVDVVNTVCPCAGLSSLSFTSGSDNPTNDWMLRAARYVLEDVRPQVFWGENAPRLASKMGEPIVKEMRKMAREFGYTVSLYKTKSILHGLSQVRDRAFYFFWKGNEVPVFEYYDRPHERIEDTIRGAATNEPDPMSELMTNKAIPSENPFYKYVLEEMEGGITHTEFFNKIEKSANPLHWIEDHGSNYYELSEWCEKNGYESQAKKTKRMADKVKSGGNVMRRTIEIGKDRIGAFVAHLPNHLTHPDADRFLNVRECLEIMKLPKDFQLQGGIKNLNHICQNVPVTTAMDMAENVKSFLAGESKLVKSDFSVQCNKTRKFWSEPEPATLESFF